MTAPGPALTLVPTALQPAMPPKRPPHRWLRAGLGVALLLSLAAGALLAAAVQQQPSTPLAALPTARDIDRAVQLAQLHDPRGKLPGITRQLHLVDRDLSLLAQLAAKRLGQARAAVRLHAGWAQLQSSVPLPAWLPPGWINLDLRVAERSGHVLIEQVRIGRLTVPGWLAQRTLPLLLDTAGLAPPATLAQRLVTQVNFAPGRVSIHYAWPADLQQALASGLLPAADQERVAAYTQLLQHLTADLAGGQARPVPGNAAAATAAASPPASAPRELSMAQLLPPVFALARQRSADSAAAVLENRAALTALALMVNTAPLPARRAAPGSDAGYNVTLLGRQDTPLHFLISAALSAEVGSSVAHAVGLYKELSDSRGGSGFSFNDLAADRAGIRLGRLAVRDPLALQARLASGVQEDDLMPMVADLPEALTQGEFERRFGGVHGSAYRLLLQDIEARLDRLALHAPAGLLPGH